MKTSASREIKLLDGRVTVRQRFDCTSVQTTVGGFVYCSMVPVSVQYQCGSTMVTLALNTSHKE